jgi:hypothetical protein
MDDSSSSSNLATAGKPSQTIYVNNLNEKIKLPKLKQTLATTFRPLGNVLEVIALSNVPPPNPPLPPVTHNPSLQPRVERAEAAERAFFCPRYPALLFKSFRSRHFRRSEREVKRSWFVLLLHPKTQPKLKTSNFKSQTSNIKHQPSSFRLQPTPTLRSWNLKIKPSPPSKSFKELPCSPSPCALHLHAPRATLLTPQVTNPPLL